VPAIQRFVNAAFSAEMIFNEETRQAKYSPLEPERVDLQSQPAIVALRCRGRTRAAASGELRQGDR